MPDLDDVLEDSLENSLSNPLASENSTMISLDYLKRGIAGLNEHRKSLYSRVPETYDWAKYTHESITLEDLAYLSAYCDHEFALLRGKNEDILYHGDHRTCPIEKDGTLRYLLENKKIKLVAHTHNDINKIIPSDGDRNFLKQFDQDSSIIVSYVTGKSIQFFADRFREE